MRIEFNTYSNKNAVPMQKSKRIAFKGISGSISKEFNIDQLYLNIIKRAQKHNIKRPFFVNYMIEHFKAKRIIDESGKIILPAHKIIINNGKNELAPVNLNNTKILVKGGEIYNETVKTLNVKGGLAQNITTQGFKATGGHLNSIEVQNENRIIIAGNARVSNLTANESYDILLSEKSTLNNGIFPRKNSTIFIKNSAYAKNINANTKLNLAEIKDNATLNGYKGFKLIVGDKSNLKNFHVKLLEIKSNFSGVVKQGRATTVICANGIVDRIAAKNANILNAATLKDSAIDTLTVRDSAKVIGGNVKTLIVCGNNTKIKNLYVSEKIIQMNKDKNGNLTKQIFDPKDNAVKEKYNLR